MKMPRSYIIPVGGLIFGGILTIITIMLSIICIEAGARPGQLEGLYIAKLNMSQFGQDLIPNLKEKLLSNPTMAEEWASINAGTRMAKRFGIGDITDGIDGVIEGAGDLIDNSGDVIDDAANSAGDIVGDIAESAGAIKDKVLNGLDDIIDNLAGDISGTLGIPEYFTLHMKDVCMMHAVDEEGKGELTCSDAEIGYGINLDGYLDKQLTIASFKVPLKDLLGEHIQEVFKDANDAITAFIKALCILYIIGVSGAAGSFLATLVVCFFIIQTGFVSRVTRLIIWIGLAFSGISAFFLIIGSACTTLIASVANSKLGDAGDLLNINISGGDTFVNLTWTMVTAMMLVTLIWLGVWWRTRRTTKGGSEQEYEMDEQDD